MKKNDFRLLFITSNPRLALFAVEHGVDRIFLDLEIIGKEERQGHLDTVVSGHNMDDIANLRPILPAGSLLVRLNPCHSGTETEIDNAILRGADTLMLPMFRNASEVKRFCHTVDSRAGVCLLVETVDAMKNLAECIGIKGVSEVHIGLNDLHLEMGCRFMFEPLVSKQMESMAEILRNSNMPFGIGGLARYGEGMLPAELILAEHARLGSTGAILSRTFHRRAASVEEIQAQMNFSQEIIKLRSAYHDHCNNTHARVLELHSEIRIVIDRVVGKMLEQK